MIQKNDIILVIVKKILSLLLILGAFVAAADDSYLYWMVTADNYKPGIDYATVKIAAKNNSSGAVSYLTSYSYGDGAAISGDSVRSAITSAYAAQGMGLYAALGSYASESYSFAIELFNEGGNYVAQSSVADGGWVNFSSLAQYIINSPMATPVATWAPSSYAVPEPSSGLLMLLGGALLALRRRKLKLA